MLAGDNYHTQLAVSHYGFSRSYLPEQATEMAPVAPLLNSPTLVSRVPVKMDLGFSTTRTDFTPLMSALGSPIVVYFKQGMGRVILSATPYIFSNVALKDAPTSILVLNIIALTGQKGPVWFDEWHHGFHAETIVGPWQWLKSTPGGHAILFIVGTLFLAMILQGRTFGRPVPLAYEIKRRSPLEHVTAIANLNRKAGHSSEVLKQYHQRLKRHLGQRYRLDPTMSDEEYVYQLSHYNPSIDKNALRNLLNRLSQSNVNEAELLKLASEAARLINERTNP